MPPPDGSGRTAPEAVRPDLPGTRGQAAALVGPLLAGWLGDVTPATFTSVYLQRTPVARPGSARGTVPLLDRDVLASVLSADEPPADTLVVSRGRLRALPPPRTLTTLRSYLDDGIGLCLRRTERCDPGLGVIARDLGCLGKAHVQIFVTPANTYGFGWHYDEEDVFIVQTEGVKDYYFRANTTAQETPSAAAFARFADETTPVLGATLIAGDFLYLPRRWWHFALCREESLSISVGVTLSAMKACAVPPADVRHLEQAVPRPALRRGQAST